ncbi:MAG: hypothetical protein CMD18_04380 [Flavobacteriales bacterium]|nr:hypothetical protein [Flavobacteriales bacterium]|tara:strand:- start:7119 stop:8816 length:1698 start_codon:yes stop_codon:yes gene_type:complete
MKKSSLILFALLVFKFGIRAQELTSKWSDKIELHNSKDGFFSYFLGENKRFLYAYFSKKGKSERKKIVAFDKKTMKRQFATEVIGYPSNSKDSKKFKGLDLYKTIVYDDVLHAFFKSDDKNSKSILVKSFSAELKVKEPLKKIISQPKKEKRKNKSASLFVMGNKETGKVFIGVEKETVPKDNVVLEYKVLDSDFSISDANQITLPIRYKGVNWFRGGADGLSSSYLLGDDGNVHIRKGSLLGIINLTSGKLTTTEVKTDEKRLFSIYRMVSKSKTRLYGYYSDLTRDRKGREVHGIFYAILTKDYKIKNMVFSGFNKKLMKELFKDDKDDKDGGRKGGCCLIGKKGSTHANDETMNSDYIIEEALEGDGGSVYLFTTKMDNYSVRSCTTDANGNTTCTTSYYCKKGNVTTFKISKDGDIEWASNHDRVKVYNGWFVYDISVIQDKKGFYATYGTVKNKRAKKPWFMLLKKVDYTNPMEYVFINKKSGKVSKKVLKVNQPNSPSNMAKYIDATEVTVIDNKLYVNSSKEFVTPLGYCLGGFLTPNLRGGLTKGYGFFGVLEPVKR